MKKQIIAGLQFLKTVCFFLVWLPVVLWVTWCEAHDQEHRDMIEERSSY